MISAKLNLTRFDKEFNPLERREQPCRSFIKGLMDTLYVQMAQIQSGAPFTDPYGVDMHKLSTGYKVSTEQLQRNIWGHGKVGSAGGLVSQIVDFAEYGSGNMIGNLVQMGLGSDLGIQVGTDATAVTTTDRRMTKRIGHGRRAPDGGSTLFENFVTGDNTDFQVYVARFCAFPFMPMVDHRVDHIGLKVWKTGAPAADLTVTILPHMPSSATPPTGFWISSSLADPLATFPITAASIGGTPGVLTDYAIASPFDVYAGHIYWIVCSSPGSLNNSNCYNIRVNNATTYDRVNPLGIAGPGQWIQSVDSGATWSVNSTQAGIFREYGRSQGEFDYGGCELLTPAFADPNGSMVLRRLFSNNCGSSLGVQESGIVGLIGQVNSVGNFPGPNLIAHDNVAPVVTVNNTELLLVQYTVSITV